MATSSPYRMLPIDRRVDLVAHDLKSSKEARDGYIQRMVSRKGGFRPVTLRSWPVDKLAREIVRLNMETPQDELGLLQTLYVEREPDLQIAFLDGAGVAHSNGQIPEDLATPFADPARVRRAAEQLIAQRGDAARHYLRTIAYYNGEAWPNLLDMLDERDGPTTTP